MTERKSYDQYCAIAMALDRVGDRWTLLILRDLMAGPARFVDLSRGLPGIASNLLTERLRQLEADGIVEHTTNEHGTALYALTPRGEGTRPILESLGMWGRTLEPPTDQRHPESYRSLALALRSVLSAGLPAARAATVDLDVEGQHFEIVVEPENVEITYRRAPRPEAELRTEQRALAAVMITGDHAGRGSEVLELAGGDPEAARVVADLMETALARVGASGSSGG